MDLLKGLSHLELYTDNYYTSPELYLHLYNESSINACGTIRTNRRGYPKALVLPQRVANQKLRGFMMYSSNGPLLAYAWKDRRMVYFLTTAHVAQAAEDVTIERRGEMGQKLQVKCPPLLPDYQKFMRGVDHGDQLISQYNAGRRSKKWWRREFFYLLEVAILNAYILEGSFDQRHNQIGRKKRDLLAFRIELAEALIGTFRGKRRAGQPRIVSDDARLKPELHHLPEHSPVARDCVVCCKRGEVQMMERTEYRHRTHIVCSACKVYLCVNKERDCFKKYHLLVQYWR